MRKIIFLDVDGVLNNGAYTEKCARKLERVGLTPFYMNFERVPFNPRSLKNLQKIVLKTGAEIVLHSTWKDSSINLGVLQARLAEYGIKIKEKADGSFVSRKEDNISKYLAEHTKELKEEIQFVIIDDDNLKMPCLVQTDYRCGLTNRKAQKCIEILNKEG